MKLRWAFFAPVVAEALLKGSDGDHSQDRDAEEVADEKARNDKVAATGGRFKKLVETFYKMKDEAKKVKDTHTKDRTDKEFNCKKKYAELDDNIAAETADRDEAAEKEASAVEAREAAKAAKEKAIEDIKNAESGKASAETNYGLTKARMANNVQELTTAITGLEGVITNLGSNAALAQNTKDTMVDLVKALRAKMSAEKENLTRDVTSGQGSHQATLDNYDKEIETFKGAKKTAADEQKNQAKIAGDQKAAKITAVSNINKYTTEKSNKEKTCREDHAFHTEMVDTNTAQEAALEHAIQILSDGSNAPASPSTFLQVTSGFLQARDPRGPLLNLLSKYGKQSVAGKFISNALATQGSGDKKVAAFQSLKGEIESLISTLQAQQQKDLTDLNWCKKKEQKMKRDMTDLLDPRELTAPEQARADASPTKAGPAEDASGSIQLLELKKDAAEKKADSYKNQVADAAQRIKDAHADLESNVDENHSALQENKEQFRTLNEDLSLLKQAYTALENTFKGVKLMGENNSVLDVVDSLIGEYSQNIEENKAQTRQLETMRDSIRDEHASTVKMEQRTEEEMFRKHKDAIALAQKTQNEIHSQRTQYNSLRQSFLKIFDEGGKCHVWRKHFGDRRSIRGKEIDNLKGAQNALSDYMESIGIRVSGF